MRGVGEHRVGNHGIFLISVQAHDLNTGIFSVSEAEKVTPDKMVGQLCEVFGFSRCIEVNVIIAEA